METDYNEIREFLCEKYKRIEENAKKEKEVLYYGINKSLGGKTLIVHTGNSKSLKTSLF
jgi:hypothetical protein